MILGIDLLTALGLDLKFSKNTVIGGEGPYKGCYVQMVDISHYKFKFLRHKIFKLEYPLLMRTLTNDLNTRAQ